MRFDLTQAKSRLDQIKPTLFLSPIGELTIYADENYLYAVHFGVDPAVKKITTGKASLALTDYFSGKKNVDAVTVAPFGTAFQQRVWQALATIPYGENTTYGGLAKKLKTGPRAIGNACRHNPIPILIPCHRVLAHNGLGGYGGVVTDNKLQHKKFLLALESRHLKNPSRSGAMQILLPAKPSVSS